jgi:hypothetical protein
MVPAVREPIGKWRSRPLLLVFRTGVIGCSLTIRKK